MSEIFEILKNSKAISQEVACAVEKYCSIWSCSGFHGLIETNVLSESEICSELSHSLKLDRIYEINPKDRLDTEAEFIPYKMAIRWECFPIRSHDPSCLFEVILADPTQRKRIDWMKKKTNNQISLAVGERRHILQAINQFYPIEQQLDLVKDIYRKTETV